MPHAVGDALAQGVGDEALRFLRHGDVVDLAAHRKARPLRGTRDDLLQKIAEGDVVPPPGEQVDGQPQPVEAVFGLQIGGVDTALRLRRVPAQRQPRRLRLHDDGGQRMAGGVVDLLGDAVALLDDGRLLHLLVGAHQLVAALLELAQVFLDLAVFARERHGESEHDEVQHDDDQPDEVLRREVERAVKFPHQHGVDDVHHGIGGEIDAEHDGVVAQRRGGEIELGQHADIDEVAVRRLADEGIDLPPRKDVEQHEQDAVEHIQGDLVIKFADEKDLRRQRGEQQQRHGQREDGREARPQRDGQYDRGAGDDEEQKHDDAQPLRRIFAGQGLPQGVQPPLLPARAHARTVPARTAHACSAPRAAARRARLRSLPSSSAISLAPPGVFSRAVSAMRTHQRIWPFLRPSRCASATRAA